MGCWMGKRIVGFVKHLFTKPKSNLEPAAHLNRFESEKYCKYKGGFIIFHVFEEWKLAAYTQILNSEKYNKGTTYNVCLKR